MFLKITKLYLVYFFASLVCAQNNDDRPATLKKMIDYTAQFVNQNNAPATQQLHPVDTGKLEDDPGIRNLFKEFLVQYQQLADEQKVETTITSTTTENPFKNDFSNLFTSPPIYHAFPNIPRIPSTPQNRRISKRRKVTTPIATRESYITSSTTPFSTLLGRVNSLHHESVETTTFPTLRQRFFGVESSKPKKTLSIERKTSPFVFQTTPAAQVLVEEPSTTQPPRFVPNVKIPQRLVNIPSKPQISIPKAPVTTSKIETTTKKVATLEFDEAEFKRQAENAKYEFASDVVDEINGNLHQREEVRDGLAVKGRYSFSDGYFKRTIHYEADDKGYRVIKEEVEPLEGPQANPDGHARVSSYVAGNAVNYQITKDDILKKNQNTLFLSPENDVAIDEV